MFEHLGRVLNFRQTAEEAGLAQPALSRGIGQLEAELGFKLFERTTRSTVLTPAGQVLHYRVQQWLDDMERAYRECHQLAAGGRDELLLGYSAQASYGSMSQKLFQFGMRHPKVSLNLRLVSSEAAYEEIATGQLHGAFALHDAALLASWGLASVPVETQRVVALCAREHPLARRRVVRLRELARWGLAIGNEARWKIFRSIVLSAFSAAAVPIQVAYEADDTPLLLEAIAQSDCVGLFGEGLVSQLPASLVALPLDTAIRLPVCYALPATAQRSAQALADFLAGL